MNPLKAVFSEAGLFLLLCCIEILLPIFAVESPLNSLVFGVFWEYRFFMQ